MRPFFVFFQRFVTVLFGLWIVGCLSFPLYVRCMSRAWCQKTGNVDAVVVFTGGAHRLCAARSLYQGKAPKKLHISGVGWKGKQRTHRRVSWDSARNTWENILLTGRWMRQENINTIQLVTSDYHMPRCLLLAKFLWPGIRVKPYAVISQGGCSFFLLFSEYNKCCGSLFFVFLRCVCGKESLF